MAAKGPDIFWIESLGLPLNAGPSAWGHDPLPDITPQFVLLSLDEYGPGSERLIHGLEFVRKRAGLHDSSLKSSGKGKEKAIDAYNVSNTAAEVLPSGIWQTLACINADELSPIFEVSIAKN